MSLDTDNISAFEVTTDRALKHLIDGLLTLYVHYVRQLNEGRTIRKNNTHFNKSYILVLFKCFFKVDWNFNLSLNKKRKASNLPDLEFLQHYVELCSDQSIIHLPQPEIAVLWKACKSGATERDAVSTHFTQDCLQDKFLFQHWF